MSYVKRLKLKNFKSFANPTILEFEKGFNTVIGANGSGKSNIFDALCFVLGRMSSKELRTEKLGNLVFNGGKNLKPAKEAEVSIFLSNEDKELLNNESDEVKITRIVKADGGSKYLLNDSKVTRTEIVEVLRKAHIDPDGYNIILQGDITRIVNMSVNERRELIEEISNISGYEEQRDKSLVKLEKLDVDLKEADLLMEEKTKYLKELKSEKEQAERFHQTKEELRFNNLLLIKAKIAKNLISKTKKEEEFSETEKELTSFKDKLDEFENKNKDIEAQITKIEKTIEIKSHEDFIAITNKITALEGELINLREKKAENKKNTEELKVRTGGVKENIVSNKKKISELEIQVKELSKTKLEFEKELKKLELEIVELKKGVSSESFREIDEIDKQIDEINAKKMSKIHVKQDNSIHIEKFNSKLEHLENEMKKIEGLNSSNKTQVKELENNRSELKKIILAVSQMANKNSESSAKLNTLQKEYNALMEEHMKLKLKAESSKELISSNKAVEAMMKIKQNDRNIHGTVAELATVPEKYSLAMETISGKNLFNIVVENDSTAVKYINYLKENRIGNATFLPLNKINAKFTLDSSVLNKKGVIDYALNLIKYDKRYEHIFHLIFSDTVVIEKIEDAKSIGIGEYKMVTLEGDYVAKTGAMSGGFINRKQSLNAFKDDKSVEKLASMDMRIGTLVSSIEHLREEKDSSEREVYELRSRKSELEGDISKLEKLLSIEGRDTEVLKKEIEAILSDKSVIESSLKKIDRDISDLDEQLKKLIEKKAKLKGETGGHAGVLSKLSKLEEEKDILKQKIMGVTNEIDLRNIQINSVILPEMKNLEKILKEADESFEKMKVTLDELTLKINSSEESLKESKTKEKELSRDYKQYLDKRDALKEEKVKLEQKYEKEFARFDKLKERSTEIRFALSEFETMLKTLAEELDISIKSIRAELIVVSEYKENVGSDIVENLIKQVEKTIHEKIIDIRDLQTKVNNLKTKLSSFGSINMKAVQIYDKLNEEFNILLEKRETINTDREEILKFIAEMDEKKKERFMDTFQKLHDQFSKTFATLSTKGKAELVLEDENDIFNTGVMIQVKLSEKNYLDIKSLSGGEKTITAVAFIFAVQEFNPASFYIFDEIDAALDIINSEKLGKLLKSSSNKAQYIVVSHSEHLIQSAEIIYGVTMDTNKISGVLSLDLRNMGDYIEENIPKVENN